MKAKKDSVKFNTFGRWVNFETWPSAADRDAVHKIDCNHTSDVLSEHITVTQTSHSLIISTQSLILKAAKNESPSLLAIEEKRGIKKPSTNFF